MCMCTYFFFPAHASFFTWYIGIIMSKAAEEDQSKIEDYASEMKVIKKLLSAERNAIVGGFVVGMIILQT